MADTLNSLVTLTRKKIKDFPTLLDYIASAATNSGIVMQVGEGNKINKGDILEIGEEAIFVEEIPYLGGYMEETAELSNSATEFGVGNSARFTANDIIKVDNERMKVSKVSAIGSSNLKVTRAERGTEAAVHKQTSPVFMTNKIKARRGQLGTAASAHAISAVINVINGWSDFEVRDAVKTAIRNLFPDIFREYSGKVGFQNNANFIILDNADATTSWNEGADAVAATLNTSSKIEGTGSLNLGVTLSAGTGTYTKTITSVDISNTEYVTVRFYVEEVKDSSDENVYDQASFLVEVGSGASDYHAWTIRRHDLHPGWNVVSFALAEASDTGSPDDTAVVHLKVTIDEAKTIAIGNIRMDAWTASNFPYTDELRRKYRLPKGVFGVNHVSLIRDETDDDKLELQGWHVEGEYEETYLVFDSYPPYSFPIEIYGRRLFEVPSANTTNIAGQTDPLRNLISLEAANQLLDDLVIRRGRFDKYVAKIEKQGSGPLDIFRTKRQIQEDLKQERAKYSRGAGSVDLDWGDLDNTFQGNINDSRPFDHSN